MKQIIWLKTPKCAGTSIKTVIQNSELKDKIIIVLPDHLQEFISGYPELWSSYYKFTIVRNPFDKFISAWKYLKLTNVHSLSWVIKNLPTEKAHYKGYHHLTRTQCETIGNHQYNKIIKYEDLFNGISDIFKKVGVENVTLPFTNQSDRMKDYRAYYDNETRDAVSKLYAEDLDRFNYEF